MLLSNHGWIAWIERIRWNSSSSSSAVSTPYQFKVIRLCDARDCQNTLENVVFTEAEPLSQALNLQLIGMNAGQVFYVASIPAPRSTFPNGGWRAIASRFFNSTTTPAITQDQQVHYYERSYGSLGFDFQGSGAIAGMVVRRFTAQGPDTFIYQNGGSFAQPTFNTMNHERPAFIMGTNPYGHYLVKETSIGDDEAQFEVLYGDVGQFGGATQYTPVPVQLDRRKAYKVRAVERNFNLVVTSRRQLFPSKDDINPMIFDIEDPNTVTSVEIPNPDPQVNQYALIPTSVQYYRLPGVSNQPGAEVVLLQTVHDPQVTPVHRIATAWCD